MVITTKPTYHVPGYTGFIAGGQHEFAKTYGEATRHALDESLPKDTHNKDKWEKYTNYAVSTQPRVPNEGYFITGYSGFVQGVAAENIHAKTYGTATYSAIGKKYVEGQDLKGKDRFVTNVMDEFKSYGHPGDTAKFSLLNHDRGQLRTNSVKDTDEPVKAERPTKKDPYTLEMEQTKTDDKHHVPGYTGFVPGIGSENLYSRTYARTTADAYNLKADPEFCTKTAVGTIDGMGATKSFENKDKLIPGYRGFTPHVKAENIYGNTYGHTTSKVLEQRVSVGMYFHIRLFFLLLFGLHPPVFCSRYFSRFFDSVKRIAAPERTPRP